MKQFVCLLCLLTVGLFTTAQNTSPGNLSIAGTWKFSKKSVLNDYDQVFGNLQLFQTEYYTFGPEKIFRHYFIDKAGLLVKTLEGSWRSNGKKIRLKYSTIDFKISLEYHFTDNDLVFIRGNNIVMLTRGWINDEVTVFN